MRASSKEVDGHARRLLATLDDPVRLRNDPVNAVPDRFGIRVDFRASVSSDCDIDGSYHHEARTITVDSGATVPRQRFTILHELAHALARTDGALADWLIGYPDGGRLEEERVANAFASLVLLPDDVVDECIGPGGPTALDIHQLIAASGASREAACVRASQLLRGPGLVVLSRGPIVQLAITRGLPMGLRRGSDMGEDSFFASAANRSTARQSGVRLVFPESGVQSSPLEADAATDDRGYTISILMEHGAPWVSLTAAPGAPVGHDIECELCEGAQLSFKAECPKCGDRPCPVHGCSCDRPTPTRVRHCAECNIQLPSGAPSDATHCDMHS